MFPTEDYVPNIKFWVTDWAQRENNLDILGFKLALFSDNFLTRILPPFMINHHTFYRSPYTIKTDVIRCYLLQNFVTLKLSSKYYEYVAGPK